MEALKFKHRVDLSFLKYGFVISQADFANNKAFVEKAIAENGGHCNSVGEDMATIRSYICNNFTKYDTIVDRNTGATIETTCVGGAYILETYAYVEWNKTGFFGQGTQYPSSHRSFNLDESPNSYYEAEGKKSGSGRTVYWPQ